MKPQKNELEFVLSGRPKIIPGLYSNKGWEKYSFDVFNGKKEQSGLLEVFVSQRPENETSMRFYVFDANDYKSARIFDIPVLYPPTRREDLFEDVQEYARNCYERRYEREPVVLENAVVNT